MPSPKVLQIKKGQVEEVTRLFHQYPVIGVADLHKVRAAQLQTFKKTSAQSVYMKVIKNSLFLKAIEKMEDKPDLHKLAESMGGSNICLFTELNPFHLLLLLEKGKVHTTARAGDIAAFDIIVPRGNTGQPPGPIISQLTAVGLPARIESGSVWVSKDTLVAHEGDVISERLASVLTKLGIKPVEASLTLDTVYDNGIIITKDQLTLNLTETKQRIQQLSTDAFALSISITYPTPENMTTLLQLAHHRAHSLSLNAAIPTKETTLDLLAKAHMDAVLLHSYTTQDTTL